jgi:hypothetical protein
MALTTDDLRRIRLEVGSKCERCAAPEFIREDGKSSLHVHHIIERDKPGGTDHRDNLEVLCPKCHSKEHAARREPQPPKPEEKRRQFPVVGSMDIEEIALFHRVRISMGIHYNAEFIRRLVADAAKRLERSGKLVADRDPKLEAYLKERVGIVWVEEDAPAEEAIAA